MVRSEWFCMDSFHKGGFSFEMVTDWGLKIIRVAKSFGHFERGEAANSPIKAFPAFCSFHSSTYSLFFFLKPMLYFTLPFCSLSFYHTLVIFLSSDDLSPPSPSFEPFRQLFS